MDGLREWFLGFVLVVRQAVADLLLVASDVTTTLETRVEGVTPAVPTEIKIGCYE